MGWMGGCDSKFSQNGNAVCFLPKVIVIPNSDMAKLKLPLRAAVSPHGKRSPRR
jgi:hypothetical protein